MLIILILVLFKIFTMKFLVCFLALCIASSLALQNYLNDPLYGCVQCLCHARTGCWRRQNCASYSINRKYWETAGSLTLSPTDDPASDESYRKCMRNENCIVGTIIEYSKAMQHMDCNCDGKFDCKDMFALHMEGSDCGKFIYDSTFAHRFNTCAARVGSTPMVSNDFTSDCTPEPK